MFPNPRPAACADPRDGRAIITAAAPATNLSRRAPPPPRRVAFLPRGTGADRTENEDGSRLLPVRALAGSGSGLGSGAPRTLTSRFGAGVSSRHLPGYQRPSTPWCTQAALRVTTSDQIPASLPINNLYSLIWQRSPDQPDAHEHWKAPLVSMHLPPFLQGPMVHGLSTTWQLSPEKPSGHVQWYSSGRGFSHVPPLTHALCVPQ